MRIQDILTPQLPTAPKAEKPAKPAEAEAKAAIAKDTFQRPSVPETYTIRSGDTLTKLAKRFGMSLGALLVLNPHLTEGPRRRMDGSRVFPGDVVKLKGKAPEPQPAEPQRPADNGEVDKLKGELEAAKAAQAIARAKFQLASLPKPAAWRSQQEATDVLAKADALLAKVPEGDEERPALAEQVEATKQVHGEMLATLAELAKEPKQASKTKDKIQALDAAHVALATPAQKAALVRNLVRWDNADTKAEKKILTILEDAKRQGQLGETLDAMHGMDRKALGLLNDRKFMTYLTARVMSDERLEAYAQLLQGEPKAAPFLEGIANERDRREAERYGSR